MRLKEMKTKSHISKLIRAMNVMNPEESSALWKLLARLSVWNEMRRERRTEATRTVTR